MVDAKFKSVPHDSAFGHVAGASEFIDDRLPLRGELQVGFVPSTIAHGTISKLDIGKALEVEGVAGIYSFQDLVHNRWGTIFEDQPILAEDRVQFYGEPILVIAAEDRKALSKAKKEIEIQIQPEAPILSIDEARRLESWIGPPRKIERGDVEKAFQNAPHRLEGVLEMAGQDHFYLESQAAIAYPGENRQIKIHVSSQHPTEVQHVVARCLGLKFHEVVCVVKRMGGGFGGKESQAVPFAVMAALVAQKTGKSARIILTKDEDMMVTGKRNPFQNYYRVGFDEHGKILALDVQLYSNGGAYADLSTAIMERAMLHCDNAYYIPNVRISGQVCRTHFHPHTAFRGFGAPKGVATIENIIEEIALVLRRDAYDIRRLNCYQNGRGTTTPYGQEVDQDMIPRLFDQVVETSSYRIRRLEIEEFNQTSKTEVRGLSVTAVKFGISFTTRFLNQGSALVNVHTDGSIQVSTGATEMGQGTHTRIAQAVSQAFSIPIQDVRIMPTSTEKNHNTSPTAASSGSDLNGSAALKACAQIKGRLSQLALKLFERPEETRGRKVAAAGIAPEIQVLDAQEGESISDQIEFKDGWVCYRLDSARRISFKDLVEEAYLNRISLGAHGFARYENIFFNKETGRGNPFFYFTNGVAVSEVAIDRFTGEVKVRRTDVLMDLGRPLNYGIDLGQVSGGFVQGMGWVTTEKLHYDTNGALKTISPSTYKIPGIHDIPRVFNIDLLENRENEKNFLGNKAVGEPPLLLGISVWTAIKNALSYLSPQVVPKIRIPATQEEILCSNAFSK